MRTPPRGYRRAWLFLTVVIALLPCVSCRPDRQTESYLEKHSQELVDLTVPVDFSSLARGSVQQTTWAEKMSWEFDTKMTRAEYGQWLNGRLRGRYRMTNSPDSQLHFVRNLGADTEVITVQTVLSGDHLHVRVDASISPD